MDSILIIGGHGLLGAKLVEQARASGEWEVHFTTHSKERGEDHKLEVTDSGTAGAAEGAGGHVLEVTDYDAVEKLLKRLKPSAVIDTAAFHNVDACEKEQDSAMTVNALAPGKMAELCTAANSHFIFTSTDFVFDGSKTSPYATTDRPNPQSFYAHSKLEGERNVLQTNPMFAVARLSVIYGWNRKKTNFVTWMLGELKAGREVKVVMDQKSSPTLADSAAEALLRIAKMRKPGIWHTTGKECLARHEFALIAAEVFGFDKALIKPVPTSALNQIAKRPANSCLDVSKTERELGVKMLTAREGLMVMKKQLEETHGEILIPTKHK